MEINADFAKPVLAHTGAIDWIPSPMAGVDRKMLDRIGDEVARATSIVRYAEGSAFSEHTHSGGEEFIVLEGVFQDEHGDYPAGTYVRNPVGTHHIPRSEPGCTIFVKLWQFDPSDQDQFALDLNSIPVAADPDRPGVSQAELAVRDYERVSLERWDASIQASLADGSGVEILVLSGSLRVDGDRFEANDWLRFPEGAQIEAVSGEGGARLWIKRNHLTNIRVPPQN